MHITDIILLIVKDEGENGLKGRGFLQKKFYLLSAKSKRYFGFDTSIYGPYSSHVALNLDRLVYCKFIKEINHQSGSADEKNIFDENRGQSYFLTDDTHDIWDDIESKPLYSVWQNNIKELNTYEIAHDFSMISIASKVKYIVNWRENNTVKEALKVIKEYEWDIREKYVEDVISFLLEFGLIS